VTVAEPGSVVSTVKYRSIIVSYLPSLDGGGRGFGQYYIPVIRKRLGKVDRLCEFGCGPGFIGFSLLAHGLCNSLCMIDINPNALEMVKRTVKENGLEGKVSVYLSDGLGKVPKSEKWDLVVSNPPHRGGNIKDVPREIGNDYMKGDIRTYDPKWSIHKNFYRLVPEFLKKHGSVIFEENEAASSAEQWRRLATSNDLEWVGAFKVGRLYGIRKKSEQQIGALCMRPMRRHGRSQTAGHVSVTVGKVGNISKVLHGIEYVLDYIFNDPFYFVWSRKRE